MENSLAITDEYKFQPSFTMETIGKAYAACDLLLSRAGATTIFESAATGTPAILVPIPESAQNHQVQNAYIYEKRGAVIVLEEDNFLIGVVINEALKLLKDQNRMEAMRPAARAFYVKGSADMVARDILIQAKAISS